MAAGTSGSNPSRDLTIACNEADTDGGGWHVIATNLDRYSDATIQATAVCIAQGNFLARDAAAPKSVTAQINREVAAVRVRLKYTRS